MQTGLFFFFFFFLLRKARWDLSISRTQTRSLAGDDASLLRRRFSGWWAGVQLFSFHLHRLIGLSQASPVVLGCDGRIGAAVDGCSQHHETYDPAHNPCDDDGGHRVTQAGRPRLGFELTLWGVSLPQTVALGRRRNRLVGRTQLLPPGGAYVRRRERAGLVQLMRDLQEVLSLPGVWWRTDDTVCYSPFKKQKQIRMADVLCCDVVPWSWGPCVSTNILGWCQVGRSMAFWVCVYLWR